MVIFFNSFHFCSPRRRQALVVALPFFLDVRAFTFIGLSTGLSSSTIGMSSIAVFT